MLSYTQAFQFIDAVTETATEALKTDSPLRFGIIAVPKVGESPEYRRLLPGADMDIARAQIICNHLCNPAAPPFRFTLSRDPAEDMFGEPTVNRHITMAVCFRPYVGSRRYGWLKTQPPGTPDIVETARSVHQAWQLHTEFECEPPPVGGENEELVTMRFPWHDADSLREFKQRLKASMEGIASGAVFDGFGVTKPGQPVYDYLRNGPNGNSTDPK